MRLALFALTLLVGVDVGASPALRVIDVQTSKSVRCGGNLSVSVTFGVSKPIAADRKVFLYFRQGDALYLVANHTPTVPTSRWTRGAEVTVAGIELAIPADMPAGDYHIDAGVYGIWSQHAVEPSGAAFTVKITGTAAGGLPRKPIGEGCFVDRDGIPHRWYITHSNELVWEGEPWFPVGGVIFSRHMYFSSDPEYPPGVASREFKADQREWRVVRSKGVQDVYLGVGITRNTEEGRDAPIDALQRVVDKLDEMDFRYGMEISSGPTKLGPQGFLLKIDDYKINEIQTSDAYSIALPEQVGAAHYFLIDEATDRLVDSGQAEITTTQGKPSAKVEVRVPAGESYTLKVVPQMDWKTSAARFDFWDGGYEQYEKRLIGQLRKLELGPNFRFFVDPFWNEFGIKPYYYYHSPGYLQAQQLWLKNKYQSLDRLNGAWAMRDCPIDRFATATRLVPVFRKTARQDHPAAGYAYDFSSQRFYVFDVDYSQMWYDFHEFRERAFQTFVSRACRAIKQVHDVPVVLKRHWGSRRFFINEDRVGGLDGLGMDTYGSGDGLARFNGAATYGDLSQSQRTQWCIATETSSCGLGQTICGYPSRRAMYDDFGSLIELGVKGIFSFGVILHATSGDGGWAVCDLSRNPQQLEWLGSFARMIRGKNRLAGYQPNYHYWYPTRGLDSLSKDGFVGLTGEPGEGVVQSKAGTWIVPTYSPLVKTSVLVSSPMEPAAQARFGDALTRGASRLGVTHVVVDKHPVESLDLSETDQGRIEVLQEVLGIKRIDAPEEVEAYAFTDQDERQVILLWPTRGAPTVTISSKRGASFRIQLPSRLKPIDVAKSTTITLPELTERPLKVSTVDSTASDGVSPVEILGLSAEDVAIKVPAAPTPQAAN